MLTPKEQTVLDPQVGVGQEAIYILADAHGAVEEVAFALYAGGLINKEGAWCAAPGTLLVQLGNLLGPGPHPICTIRALTAWAQDAEKTGSQIVFVAGDKELAALLAAVGNTQAQELWGSERSVVREALEEGWLLGKADLRMNGHVLRGYTSEAEWLAYKENPDYFSFMKNVAAYLFGGFSQGLAEELCDPLPEQEVVGELDAYVQRLRPFWLHKGALFVHGGISSWLQDWQRELGGVRLDDLETKIKEDVRDVDKRRASNVLPALAACGKDVTPAISPMWINFVKEQDAELTSAVVQEWLHQSGIERVFTGQLQARHPRKLEAHDSAGRNVAVYGLDSSLGSDTDRPHLYRWDLETQKLRFLADGSLL